MYTFLWRLSRLVAGAVALAPFASIAADSNQPQTSNAWRVMVGGAVRARPEFPGADSMEVRPVPAFDIAYGERWMLNNNGLGLKLIDDRRWMLSTFLGVDLTRRDESDAPHLRGLGDVDPTAVAQIVGGYRIGAVQAVLSVATDVADEGHGTVADLSLQSRSQLSPRLALDYGIAARWINDEYARAFFGVSPQQSIRSGLSPYDAKSGVGDARVFVNALYVINPRWMLSAGGAIAQLRGDAADSPITEDKDYYTLDAAVIYRF